MTEGTKYILVCEDEVEIRELMALHLLRQGYKVTECSSAEEALGAAVSQPYDVIVIDWMLPGMSGVEAVELLRARGSQSSILMVTAKVEPQDIVLGLEKGADDYITKPFNPSVLVARVKALIRRTQTVESPVLEKETVQIDGLKINFKTYEVTYQNESLHLTPSEFKLLSTLALNQGVVLTREKLIENIQGEGISVVGRTIDTHVFGLRKKLKEWGDKIETIRGVGYRVRVDY